MTSATVSKPTAQPDTRRITEHDPALKRLKARTERELSASIQQLVRDLRRGEPVGQAQSHFIQRHLVILRNAYTAAHREGQHDYYQGVSRTPDVWATSEPDHMTLQRRMLFYAPSVAKMAHEAARAYEASKAQATTLTDPADDSETVKLYNPYPRQKGGRFGFGPGGRHGGSRKAQGATKANGSSEGSKPSAARGRSGGGGGSGGAQVEVSNEAQAHFRAMFGRELSKQEIASLVGAQPGDHVLAMAYSYPGAKGYREVHMTLTGPVREDGSTDYHASRSLNSKDNGPVTMLNQSFYMHGDMQGRGTGTRIFASEVRGLARLGVARILTSASHDGTDNGYYTWARLGYNGRLSASIRGQLPRGMRGIRTIQQLMRIPGGAHWWKSHGEEWSGTFNLKSGSVSRRALAAYLKAKGVSR